MIFLNQNKAMEVNVEFHVRIYEYQKETKEVIEFLSKMQKEHNGEIHYTLSVIVE